MASTRGGDAASLSEGGLPHAAVYSRFSLLASRSGDSHTATLSHGSLPRFLGVAKTWDVHRHQAGARLTDEAYKRADVFALGLVFFYALAGGLSAGGWSASTLFCRLTGHCGLQEAVTLAR